MPPPENDVFFQNGISGDKINIAILSHDSRHHKDGSIHNATFLGISANQFTIHDDNH